MEFQAEDLATDYSTETEIENEKEEETNFLKYHYDNDLWARVDNFVGLNSDESDPDLMAVEYFTKLLNQELPHTKIERDEDYGTFLRGLSQQEKLGSKITYSPVSDSEYPSDEEYSDNEVCSEDKRVNDFEYDDEEQASSFVIYSEEKDTLVSEFCN